MRSTQLPPMGEPQYYFEGGTVLDTIDAALPQLVDAHWFRLGSSHRVSDQWALDSEFLYAGDTALVQSGAMWVKPKWDGYIGAMYSGRGDIGYALRGAWRGDAMSTMLDVRRMHSRAEHDLREFSVLPRSYTQAIASLAMAAVGGRLILRARYSDRYNARDAGVGFSYWRDLYRRNGFAADLRFDGYYSNDASWVQLGVTFRWQQSGEVMQFAPAVEYAHADTEGASWHELASGRWHKDAFLSGLGPVSQSYFFDHAAQQSVFGARFVPQERPLSDFEIGVQRRDRRQSLFYAMNNQMSLATRSGQTAVSSGSNYSAEAAAFIVRVHGNTYEKFDVVVNNRTVGQVWSQRPSVVSVRPYETYTVRIRPAGDKIIGFDETEHKVTLYPGNVEALDFTAHELTVVIGQAVYPSGKPVPDARFSGVEGYGATDAFGWFQVEIAQNKPLVLTARDGSQCVITLPEFYAEDGLAMLDQVVCGATPAQP